MKKLTLLLSTVLLISCNQRSNTEAVKEEIKNIEKAFNEHASTKGIAAAFYEFAAEDAVIKRENDTLIKGKEAIKNYYSNPKYSKASVTWKPDLVDVSEDATMAYTYGKFIWVATDSSGTKKEFKGIFHTVWKKQTDGDWKYVWD
ncbi:YybH family protein [Flavobacterium sp. GCM10027622]|uniref:YybH family protein n=1 Tax=unclassified Flavobacterium TaxID=196869 RepID=UPI003618636C